MAQNQNSKATREKGQAAMQQAREMQQKAPAAQAAEMLQGEKVVHQFAPLPYPYDALEKAIDAKTMEIHYDRHHRAYFNNFTKAIQGTEMEYLTLEQIFANMSKFPMAVRNNGGGHYNHQLFWNIMSPDGGGEPGGKLAEAIKAQFGSFDEFKKQFEQAGAQRFGSGWAWLSVDKDKNLFISSTPNQDNPLMDVVEKRGTPILGLDVWEHAYYLRYQNMRGSYMSAFWSVVNWKAVEELYEQAIK
ncbi:MAG: superoxide dismutase [Bacteroidetes bacterium]|nr:superoxide dismutase [Bacteroidota bacterium]